MLQLVGRLSTSAAPNTAGIAYLIHLRISGAPIYIILTTGSHTSAKTSRYCTLSQWAKYLAPTYLRGKKKYIIAVQQEYINAEIGVGFVSVIID